VLHGVPTSYYFAGGQRIAMREGVTVIYLLGDHLGSTSITANSNGTLYTEQRYYPWGDTRYNSPATTPTTYQFTGQRKDATGLYFYNARYYDPLLGRFLQADTIIPSPGNPQSLNRYAYVYNNPLRYTDPTGHFTDDELEAMLGENWKELMNLWYKEDYFWWSLLKHGLHEGWTLYNGDKKITFAGSGKDIKASGNLLEWQNIETYGVEDDQGQDYTDRYFDAFESGGGRGHLEHGFMTRPKIDYSGEVPSVIGYYAVRQRMGDLQGATTTGILLEMAFGVDQNVVAGVELGVAAGTAFLTLPYALGWFAVDTLIGTGIATVMAPKNYTVGPVKWEREWALQAAYPIFGPPNVPRQ